MMHRYIKRICYPIKVRDLKTCLPLAIGLLIFTIYLYQHGLDTRIVPEAEPIEDYAYVCSVIERMNHQKEVSFEQFSYPYNGNIPSIVSSIKKGFKPPVSPISIINYSFILSPNGCTITSSETLSLTVVVKSAIGNFKKRSLVRNNMNVNPQFNGVRAIFIVGKSLEEAKNQQILVEQDLHEDLIQADFIDAYANNTLKTIMAYRWITDYCPNVKFVVFVDDDFRISVTNIIKHLSSVNASYENRLFQGLLAVPGPYPYRNPCNSKWYVSIIEYPYKTFPPYFHGGFYMASVEVVKDFSIAMKYVQPFWIDDVYLGIVAWKMGLKPQNLDKIYLQCRKEDDGRLLDPTLLATHCDPKFRDSGK